MIYAAFILYLVLIVFTAIGVYRLWTGLVRPAWVNWVLLPGTLVSEMAYILGCLITGGEIRRAKIIPSGQGSADGAPAAEASGGLRYVRPLVASLLTLLACSAAIVVLHGLLGDPVIQKFVLSDTWRLAAAPKELPGSWPGLWEQLGAQMHLLRRMLETLWEVDWTDWRVPVFVYLAACLSVRIVPVGRDLRAALGAVGLTAGLVALAGGVSDAWGDLLSDAWPLLTYIWANLLLLLVVTLLIRGIVALVMILAGKEAGRG